jgi:hypothetical protein
MAVLARASCFLPRDARRTFRARGCGQNPRGSRANMHLTRTVRRWQVLSNLGPEVSRIHAVPGAPQTMPAARPQRRQYNRAGRCVSHAGAA